MPRLPEVTSGAAAPRAPASVAPEPSRFWRRLRRALVIVAVVCAGLCVVGGIGAYVVYERISEGLPSVEKLKAGYEPPQVSRIYAADGTVLSSVFTERRSVVPFAEIPNDAKLAFLAAEDAHFYEHEGLSYLGLLRAAWANLRAGRYAGHYVQGGSTITQQVVKIILLDQRRTFGRKLPELILARRLEQSLTKDEILNLYLNNIYLGHGRYGIEEASRYYFGKRAAEIDAGEAALLAGINANATHYSPRRYPERALGRRKFVLDQMHAKGFITEQYYKELSARPLTIVPEVDTQNTLAPEAVAVARDVMTEAQKTSASQGGFSVTTTIRPDLQVAGRTAVRKALSEYADRHGLWPPYNKSSVKAWGKPLRGTPKANRVYVGTVKSVDDTANTIELSVGDAAAQIALGEEERYNPKHLPPSGFTKEDAVLRVRMLEAPNADHPARAKLELGPEAALVVIDVRTRDIVALVGSYEATPGGLDRARRARRQPGSSIKPMIYSYALHMHTVTPGTVLPLDEKGHGTGDTPPFRLTVRDALAHSNNEASVRLLQAGGPPQIVDWAHQLGIESKLGADLSLALGSYEVTPLEMCNAYTTFASGGFYEEPRLIAEVKAPGSEVVPQPERPARRRVMSAEEAYLTTSLLESVVQRGTGREAQELGHSVAGKTGTSNEVKDAWFVGFSPELSVAVWVGFDDPLPLGAAESGERTALPAFVEFMRAADDGRPRTEFPRPPGIVVATIDPETGLLPRPGQTDGVAEEFLDGTVPEIVAPEPVPDTASPIPYEPKPTELPDLPP